MATMKGIWWTGPNEIKLRTDVPIPEVGPGMIKVKIAYSALCATDMHIVSMGVMGAKFREGGAPMGHECSGTIVETAPGVELDNTGLKIGDKVVLFPGGSCGQCDNCRNGVPQYCLHKSGGGTFAEYVVVKATNAYKIPDDADMKAYSIVEPTVCTIRAMDLSPIKHGQTVMVSGVGGIGSILLDMVIHSGAAKITVSDPVPQKRENALAMGAQYVIDPTKENVAERAMEITGGRGFDHVFEVSGVPVAAQPALDSITRTGTVTYFAVFPPTYEFPLNLHNLYMKEGRIQTVFTNPDIVPRAINLIPRMQTDKIIQKIYDLKDGEEAVEMFHKSIYPKILLKCND
jgi:(R,R)-butanediol dehydrogenase/meso-butanediol dehydrogenase/diacetyl reductase